MLCVDDGLSVVELVVEFLAREDNRFTVHTETDPDIAFGHVRTEAVDCLVSDSDMPDRDGLELLDAVRDVAPELPVILFTGKGSEEIASEAISRGVTDYLQRGAPPISTRP